MACHSALPCPCAEATQLPAKGAELVEAHASDEAQLRAAFVGAHGVFAMTLSAASSGTAEERAQHELEQGAAASQRMWLCRLDMFRQLGACRCPSCQPQPYSCLPCLSQLSCFETGPACGGCAVVLLGSVS